MALFSLQSDFCYTVLKLFVSRGSSWKFPKHPCVENLRASRIKATKDSLGVSPFSTKMNSPRKKQQKDKKTTETPRCLPFSWLPFSFSKDPMSSPNVMTRPWLRHPSKPRLGCLVLKGLCMTVTAINGTQLLFFGLSLIQAVTFTRWWFLLKHFWHFHPETLGR